MEQPFQFISKPAGDKQIYICKESAVSVTLKLDHLGQWLSMTSASACVLTVPVGGWPIGAQVAVEQNGAGQITFTPAVGVTLQARGYTSTVKSNAQFAPAFLLYKGQNVWHITGDITVT